MKLLIILISVFLLALTPAKQAKKLADKYNSEYLARELKEIDKEINKEMALGEYYTYACVHFPLNKEKNINNLKKILKNKGYSVKVLELDARNCFGVDVSYLEIGWQ